MPKYKEYVTKMLSENKAVFDAFRIVHDEYALNPDHLQEQFNKEGEPILEIVREWENRLCANTERGMYNKFSTGLSEKFQAEVKKNFPMIDHIGLIVDTPKQKSSSPEITFKKINL